MKKKVTLKSISFYKKKLDAIFSKFIRARDKGQCYTCPKKDDPKYMQNGHFVPRQYLAVRYDEINCNCQCYACNMLYNGQPSAYALNLIRDHGPDIVDKLNQKRYVTFKVDQLWYIDQIDHYEKELANLEHTEESFGK